MKRVLILGGGLVGSAIAWNLDRDEGLQVTVADHDARIRQKLADRFGFATLELDVTHDEALTRAVRETDLVVGAVPGFLGYRLLETVIRAGRDVVDISFFPEDPLSLNQLAKEHEVTAVVDAGLAPGLSNLIVGRYHQEYDSLNRILCYVGGLPKVRVWPFEYQSVFSPIDVLEEYTRPVRMKVGGQIVTRPALSDVELIDLPRVGTLEAFNTDGLRTLLTTMPVPDMQEKTLRYPGHAERMRMLRHLGFFSREPLDVRGQQVVPLEVTTRLLFRIWQPDDEGRDLAVMRVSMSGRLRGKPITTTVDLYDEYDPCTGITAMARTTGHTCAAVARLVLEGTYRQPGIQPLEYLGVDKKVYRKIIGELNGWGINFSINQTLEE